MAKSYDEVLSQIRSRSFSPLYILMGDEPYFIDRLSDLLEASILTEDEKAFNQVILYGKETNTTAIMESCRQFPLMAANRVVLVREAQMLPDDVEKLDTYLDNPLDSTVLILCLKNKRIDKRRTFAKKADKYGVLFESVKLYDNQVLPWLMDHVRSMGLRIDSPAAQMLADHIGNDLSRMVTELEKLQINLPPNGLITADHVELFVGISKEFNVFALQDALGHLQAAQAHRIAHNLVHDQRESVIMVTSMLNSYFTKLLQIHALESKTSQAVASAVGIQPRFAENYLAAARNYPLNKLVRVFSLLREYDLKAKGVDNTAAGDIDLAQELVYKILAA